MCMQLVLEAFCMQHARAQFDLAARAQCRLNAAEQGLFINNVRNRHRRHWLCRLKNVGNNRMLFRKPFLLKRKITDVSRSSSVAISKISVHMFERRTDVLNISNLDT